MDFKTLSAARYSLRKFSSRPVGQEELDLILEAGRNAPTAHNYQPQRIFVLRSPEALEKIDACTGSRFHPPVMLVVAYDASVSWKRETDGKDHGEIDAAIAAAQMVLQAAAVLRQDLLQGVIVLRGVDVVVFWDHGASLLRKGVGRRGDSAAVRRSSIPDSG